MMLPEIHGQWHGRGCAAGASAAPRGFAASPSCRSTLHQIIALALCALALFAAGKPGAARAQNADMVEFIRDLYVQEIERHTARAPISDAEFFARFTADLRALMQAPRHRAGPAGPILDDFFGWGVLPGEPIKLMQVVPVSARGLVRVELLIRGETRQIVVHLASEDGLWKIVDISYDQGDSLRTYFQRITSR